MDTEAMITALRMIEEKYKDKDFGDNEVNLRFLCHDVADKIEELYKENTILKLNATCDKLKSIADNMRDATPEEQKGVNDYIKSISEPV